MNVLAINNEQEARKYLMENSLITSFLDDDFYKFTMQQVVFHHFKNKKTKFEFKNRNSIPLAPYKEIIEKQFDFISKLTYQQKELDYLSSLEIEGEKIFKEDYIESLKTFQLRRNKITVSKKGNDLDIKVKKDDWFHNMKFEVMALSIVNGVHSIIEASKNGGVQKFYDNGINILQDKINTIKSHPLKNNFNLGDMGTRRRFLNVDYQETVFRMLQDQIPQNIVGTSNVLIAMRTGGNPLGTMAHEYLQAMQAVVGIKESQKFAFDLWQEEYGKNKLGIALSDVLGMNPFFVSFDKALTETYQGARHDSGCPFEWGDKLINHYQFFNINPLDKSAVFSDGLNIPYALEILEYFNNRIYVVFGIGTNLTNDVGLEALQIVLKMVWFEGQSVAKLSDNPAKSMCKDEKYMQEVSIVVNEMNIEYDDLYLGENDEKNF
jgi:nicotinate phosphoribosyltransferase